VNDAVLSYEMLVKALEVNLVFCPSKELYCRAIDFDYLDFSKIFYQLNYSFPILV
jgi:hypothetical protein